MLATAVFWGVYVGVCVRVLLFCSRLFKFLFLFQFFQTWSNLTYIIICLSFPSPAVKYQYHFNPFLFCYLPYLRFQQLVLKYFEYWNEAHLTADAHLTFENLLFKITDLLLLCLKLEYMSELLIVLSLMILVEFEKEKIIKHFSLLDTNHL